jgi:ankyrin repeat protein
VVADETNLHDIGNLISFVSSHRTDEVEKAFLKDPGLINSRNALGTTPCLVAMACGSPRLVRFLTDHGADIHAKTVYGQDAMFFAAVSDMPRNLSYALQQGFAVNSNAQIPSGTPLESAVIANANRCVQWLTDHGADVNAVDVLSYSPLVYTVVFPNMKAFDLLLAAKANVSYHTRDGSGLMHWAVLDPQFLPKVLAAGVSVDDRATPGGATPLMSAAFHQAHFAASWLLAEGADLKAKDDAGRDAFDYARLSNTLHTDAYFRAYLGLPKTP